MLLGAALGRRSLHGERGLKSHQEAVVGHAGQSLPAWGAWVEILLVNVKLLQSRVAPWMEATCLDAIGAYCYVPEGLVRTSKGRE